MLKKFLLMMLLSVSTFAFRISDTDLDLKVKVKEKKEKEFTLKNDSNYILRYELSLEDNTNEVKVIPSTLLVPAFGEKSFRVLVRGETQGEKKYFLILDENPINLEKKGSTAKVKMKYRIEQKYVVE